MSNYIHFSPEQKDKAYHMDIAELLRKQGEKLNRCGNEYIWESPTGKVSIRNNVWYHHYEQEGGNVVSFLQKFFNKTYSEAMKYLLNENGTVISYSSPTQKHTKELILPQTNSNMRRLYEYLMKDRGISRDIITAFVHAKMLRESADYHNVLFIGYDSDGVPRHIHKRGTAKESAYKRNVAGSDNKFSFHWHGTEKEIYLFEAPIDMLSFISMHPIEWRNNSYAAACSIADNVLFQCLKDNKHIEQVYICFDNDNAGQTAAQRLSDKLFIKGIKSEILVPTLKDWNEDLLFSKQEVDKKWMVQLS